MTREADRYIVVSSDCHAGAPLDVYRDYLEASYLDEFDHWAEQFKNPYSDLDDTDSRDYRRNSMASFGKRIWRVTASSARSSFPIPSRPSMWATPCSALPTPPPTMSSNCDGSAYGPTTAGSQTSAANSRVGGPG